MAGVVASAIVPHTPRMASEEKAPDFIRPLIAGVREMGEALLKLAEKTAYRLAAEGEIPGFKVGGGWWFRLGEIDEWISDQPRGTKKVSSDVD